MFFGRHLFGVARLRWLVGEVFVVIIGILAALGIDQAWTDRLDRQLEFEYLKSIRVAIQADIEFIIDNPQTGLKRKIEAIDAVGPVVRGFAPIPDDVELFLTNVSMVAIGGVSPSFITRRVVYDDLVSTGNIRLITDPNIRTAIKTYYSSHEVNYRRLTARLTDYPEFVLGILPSELREEVDLAAMEAFNVDRALDAIMSDRFETLFNREHNLALFMDSTYKQFLIRARALLDQLDEHIKNLD